MCSLRMILALVTGIALGCVGAYMIAPVHVDEPTIRPAREPQPAHVQRVADYSPEDREFLDSHIRAALEGHASQRDPQIISLLMNAYIFDHFTRKPYASGSSGVDLLRKGEAVCGGMVITLAEMLHAQKINCRLAYLVGGDVAHSMLEVQLPNDQNLLLDPYHGVAYLDQREDMRPMSLIQVRLAVADGRTDIAMVYNGNRTGNDVLSWYVPHGQQDRPMSDYELASFIRAHGAGLAHGGYVHRVVIELEPGTIHGSIGWTPGGEWPRPWTQIAVLQDENDQYISWAHQLGDNLSMGYRIRHTYRMHDLVPGQKYDLEVHFASAYTNPTISKTAVLNIHRAGDRKSGAHYDLGIVSPNLDAFEPHIIRHTFTARSEEETLLAELSGIGTICAISLQVSEPTDSPLHAGAASVQ